MNRRSLTILILVMVAFGSPVAWAQESNAPAHAQKPVTRTETTRTTVTRTETAKSAATRVESEQTPKPAKPPRAPRAPRATSPEPEAPEPGETVQVEPVVVKLGRGGRLAVTSRIASIKVKGWDKDTVEATATSENGPRQLKAEVTGDPSRSRVFLYVPATSRRHDSELQIMVNLPRYAEVETLESQNGDIEVADLDGGVAINSGNGSVTVLRVGSLKAASRAGEIEARNIKGEVTAKTFQGGIIVSDVAGRVDVSATNGDIEVRNAAGDVRATSASGDIGVHCAKGRAEVSSASGSLTLVGIGGDAEASTASGDVAFKSAIRTGGTYRMRSISGEVEMTVQPDPPGFTATMITYSGEIDTAFPLKLDSGLPAGAKNKQVTGRYGDGQARITLDSFSGTARIVKGTAAAMKECNR